MSVNNYGGHQVLTLEECNIDESSDEPKGMSHFMRSIKEKSKKLAFPALVFLGVAAGSVASLATGAPIAPVIIALGTETVKLCSAYKDAKQEKKRLRATLTTQQPDAENNELFLSQILGGLCDKIGEMKLLGSSLKEDLHLMNITLEKLDWKIDKLLNKQDVLIETTFDEVTKNIQRKFYKTALKMLEDPCISSLRMTSNLPRESAKQRITEAFEEEGKKGALSAFYYILKLRQKFEALLQLKYFLSDMIKEKECITPYMDEYLQEEARTFLCDLEDYWGIMKDMFQDKMKIPAILVVGKTGTGKSSLCNLMAGLPPTSDKMSEGFTTSPEIEACTETTTIRESFYFGDPSRLVKIIDTPGFDDPSKNHDALVIADFVKRLRNEVKELNMIVFALNGQNPRLEDSMKAMITIIQQMFSDEVCKNISIVFTHVSMDKKGRKKRNKEVHNYDTHFGEGWAKTIGNEFHFPEASKQLDFFYLDAHYDEEDKQEVNAIEETKERFWKVLDEKKPFSTKYVQHVLTEHTKLKRALEMAESELEQKDKALKEYEKAATDRIAKENEDNQKPVDGFTFLQLREANEIGDGIFKYNDFIRRKCPQDPDPFTSFLKTIEKINMDDENPDSFVRLQDRQLLSENLVKSISNQNDKKRTSKLEKFKNAISKQNDENTIAQLAFIMEIKNFTKHALRGESISIEEGDQNGVVAWIPGKESELPTLAELLKFDTFVIPPYAKERLIFRSSSGDVLHTRLKGILTFLIDEIEDKKMMVRFRIDGSSLPYATSSFSVGFPPRTMDMENIRQKIRANKKGGPGEFYHTVVFTKKDKKENLDLGRQTIYPPSEMPIPGQLKMNCHFGHGKYCRSLLILSKTPEDSKDETPQVPECQTAENMSKSETSKDKETEC